MENTIRQLKNYSEYLIRDKAVKRLPMKLDADIITDCWSFARFAIINAYPHLESWIVNHYTQIYADEADYQCFYGIKGFIYNQLEYYDAIVKTTKKAMSELKTDEEVIDYIISTLSSGKYILLACDYKTLFGSKNTHIHDALIYGYDLDKRVFYIPVLMNNSTKWEEREISFEKLAQAYNVRKNLDPKGELAVFIYENRIRYYPITVLEVNMNYTNNMSVDMFYNDLCYTRNNVSLRHVVYNESMIESQKYRDGIWELFAFYMEFCDAVTNRKIDLIENSRKYKFPLSMKKLYEYMRLFKKRLFLIDGYYNLGVEEIVYDNIDKIINLLNITYNLAIKYECSYNKNILTKIKINLYDAFLLEKNILETLIPFLDEYILNVG